MTSISILVVLSVVLVVLAVYFRWSTETVKMAQEALVLTYAPEVYTSMDDVVTFNIKSNSKHRIMSSDDMPKKSNHLFAEATKGEWGKLYRSHHDKGVTIHDYRVGNHLRKNVLHPCCCGEKPECFDLNLVI